MLEIAGGILIAVAVLFALSMMAVAYPDLAENVAACAFVAVLLMILIALLSIPVALTYAVAPEWGQMSIVASVAFVVAGVAYLRSN